jgi:hypothetical protein
MKIDLFATTRFDLLTDNFGIYDDPILPLEPAKIVPFDDGVAKVENDNNWNTYFVPMDKNFVCYKQKSKDQESLCDALLICVRPLVEKKYDLYFVELKDKDKKAITEGIDQLKNTISIIKSCYSLSCISKKRAFLANKRHPDFNIGQSEEKEKFRIDTGGFHLIICADIPVK